MEKIRTYTVEEVTKAVYDRLKDLEARLNLTKSIRAELDAWEGKVINVRLTKALRRLLPDYIVLVQKSYCGLSIVAYKGAGMDAQSSINYNNPLTFYLTKSTSSGQRVERDVYQALNPFYYKRPQDSVAQRLGQVNVYEALGMLDRFRDVLPDVVSRWNAALRTVRYIAKEVPDIYPISRMFYIPSLGGEEE